MDSSTSNVKYFAWPSTVNFSSYVTVKLSYEYERIDDFKNWKEQMMCLLESQDVLGFVNGEILPPPENNADRMKQWRRTDRLVKGWILGSIEKEVLDLVREKPTARDVWLELDDIFEEGEEEEHNLEEGEEEEHNLEEEEEEIQKEENNLDEKEEDEEEAKKLLEEKEVSESVDLSRYLALYQAIQRGDWEFAKNFFPNVTLLTTTIISADAETALHVAVLTGKANGLVRNLVELTPHNALAAKDRYGDTALNNAAVVGNTEAAKALVNKNPGLLYSQNNNEELPVLQAALNGRKETLQYLISKCDPAAEINNPFQGQLGINLLIQTIAAGFLDIALNLAQNYPSLAHLTYEKTGRSALSIISDRELLFTRTECLSWWQNLAYHRIPIRKYKRGAACISSVVGDIENLRIVDAAPNNYFTSFLIITGEKLHPVGQKMKSMIWNVMGRLVPQVKELREKKARHEQALQLADYLCQKIVSLPQKEATSIFSTSILKAAEYGFSEIVEMIIHYYPMVAFYEDDTTGMNIFLVAASCRFENVINLLHNMSDRKIAFFSNRTDNNENNMMHLCGKLAPPNRLNLVSGAALQMQRELQWFEEMENFVNPSHRTWKNKHRQTPQMLFTKEHEKLKADGERWMKDTANACTIAAALIATVVFAAAFTIPGGIESTTGFPLFSTRPAFVIFAVSDAVSLFTSITSLLMFLSILTSRYAEQDFLYVLPNRLTLGLLSLFISITFMLVAFSAALYLLLHGYTTWFVVLVTVFASLPVTSFVLLQFPLLVDVINSTYGPGIFGKKTDRLLY